MNTSELIATAAAIFAAVTWLLGISYHLGSAHQRITTLETSRGESLAALERIWCELRRLAEQGDRMAGMHQVEHRDSPPG